MHKKLLLLSLLFAFLTNAHAQAPGESTLPSPEDPPPPAAEGVPTLHPIQEEVTRQSLTKDMPQPDERVKESSETGEKIFDWSKHKHETEVEGHPFAEKGLIRIDKEGAYYYKVKETNTNHAAALHIGTFQPTNLSNPEEAGQRGATFRENYDQTSNPAVLFMYEWQWWRSALGKFNLQAGSGIFVAQGHGHFVGAENKDLVPREVFTFAAFPNSFGMVYRIQFTDRQFLIPYVGGGISAITFTELRDDNKGPKFGGSLAAYAMGGLALSLTHYDYLARIQLNHEYGISAVYLTLEYRQLLAIVQRYDFTAPYVNGGFLIEY